MAAPSQEQLRLMEMEDEDDAASAKEKARVSGMASHPRSDADAKMLAAQADETETPDQPLQPHRGVEELFAPGTAAGTVARGFGQGLTSNTSDEAYGLIGAADAARDKVTKALGGLGIKDVEVEPHRNMGGEITDPRDENGEVQGPGLVDAYRKSRADAREANAADKEAHPWLQIAAQLGGAMFQPIPGGSVGKSAPLADKVGASALQGAGLGAANAVGDSEADLTKIIQPDEGQSRWDAFKKEGGATLKDAWNGATTGGAVGAATGAAGPLFNKAAEYLRGKAGLSAVKAAGASRGISNKLAEAGLEDTQDVEKLGRGFIENKLIPVFGSKQGVLNRVEDLQGVEGKKIGDVLRKAQETGIPFDYEQLGAAAGRPLEEANAVQRMADSKAQRLVEAFRKQGELTPGSFPDANAAKSAAWSSANLNNEAPEAAQLYRKVTGEARKNIGEQIENATRLNTVMEPLRAMPPLPPGTPTPEELAALRDWARTLPREPGELGQKANRLGRAEADKFTAANNKWGTAEAAGALAKDAMTKEAAKAMLSLPEIMALATAAGTAGAGHSEIAGGGLAAALALHWAKNHGYGPLTHGFETMSKAADAAPGALTKAGARAPLDWSSLTEEEKK